MLRRLSGWIWFPALILVMAGCTTMSRQAGSSPGTNAPAFVASPEELERAAEAHAHFLAGLSHDQNRNFDLALKEYEQAVAKDPAHEALLIELSRRYLQKKDYTNAIAILKKGAERSEEPGLMQARLALIYLQQGRTNDAIRASQEAIKAQPGSISGYQGLFHLHRALGQTNEARKVVELAGKQKRPDATFLIDLAHLHLAMDAENFRSNTNSASRQEARQLLLRAASLETTNLVALQRLAQGLLFAGESKKAAEVYAKILKEEPDLIGIREALAEIYLRDNEPGKAAEQLQEIVRDTPTNPQAHYLLGAIAYEEKQFEKALEHYRKALLLGLDNQQVYFDIAVVHLSQDKPRDAILWLERARKKFRQTFVGEFYTGLAYMRLKEYTNALEYFTAAEIVAKATETNRLTHAFYFEVGAAHERAGKIEESVRYFQQCLALKPNAPEALNYLGYMWAERGTNLAQAREMIEQAVKLNPTNAAYLDSLGWVLFKQGHAREALTPIRKAIELNEEPDATLYDHLGDIEAALNNTEAARKAWKKSLEIEPNKEIEKKLRGSPPGTSP